MQYLGIDYGEKRIGLSFSDSEIRIAVPIPAANQKTTEARLAFIEKQIQERNINALVVGYPYNMDGSIGPQAQEVDQFIHELKNRFSLPVYRMDERLTTHQALNEQLNINIHAKPKSVKKQRSQRAKGALDSKAAAIILQDFLDNEKR